MRNVLRAVINIISSIFCVISMIMIFGSVSTESLSVMEMVGVFSIGMVFLWLTIELQLFINDRL
jgi:hypothetical protein